MTSRFPPNRNDLDDLLLKRLGQPVSRALRGSGYSKKRMDQLCLEHYGMSFSDKRDELWQAEVKTMGRNNSRSSSAVGRQRGNSVGDYHASRDTDSNGMGRSL